MKKISRLLKYLAEYKGKIGLYFLFNLLSILFGLVSFALVVPVLKVLFDTKSSLPSPSKTISIGSIDTTIDYFKNLLLQQNKVTALAWICVAVVVFTILKNLFLYFALYILNPLRNAVLPSGCLLSPRCKAGIAGVLH